MKRLSIELHGVCDQVTSSSILDHDMLGSSMAHIRAGPELQKDSTPVSEQKHFILLNNLIPTSTLEGETTFRGVLQHGKVWRAWGQESSRERWQELSKRAPTIILYLLKLIFQRQSICHVEEKQSSSCLPQGTLCIPCNTPAGHILSLPAFLPPCIAAQWPMLSLTSFATQILRDFQWSWTLTSTENASSIDWSSQISKQMSCLPNRSNKLGALTSFTTS